MKKIIFGVFLAGWLYLPCAAQEAGKTLTKKQEAAVDSVVKKAAVKQQIKKKPSSKGYPLGGVKDRAVFEENLKKYMPFTDKKPELGTFDYWDFMLRSSLREAGYTYADLDFRTGYSGQWRSVIFFVPQEKAKKGPFKRKVEFRFLNGMMAVIPAGY